MTLFYIYLVGLVLAVVFFYAGAVRGKAQYPEIMSLLFGIFWFITLPAVLIMAFRKEE